MDLPAIQTGLQTLATKLTGLDMVQWEDERDAFHETALVVLNILTVRGKGVDCRLYEQDTGKPAGSDLIETVAGNRYFTLSFRVLSYEQTAERTARYYLEIARTRFRWQSTLDTLSGLGLALVTLGPLVTPNSVLDERVRSFATMDVVLGTTSAEADTENGGSFISQIKLSSHLQRDGVDLPSPPNYTDDTIPSS